MSLRHACPKLVLSCICIANMVFGAALLSGCAGQDSLSDEEPETGTVHQAWRYRRSCGGTFTVRCEEGGAGEANIKNIVSWGYANFPNEARRDAAQGIANCLISWANAKNKTETGLDGKFDCKDVDGVNRTWNALHDEVKRKAPNCSRLSTKGTSTGMTQCPRNLNPWGDKSP
jgi:hypothetical protein